MVQRTWIRHLNDPADMKLGTAFPCTVGAKAGLPGIDTLVAEAVDQSHHVESSEQYRGGNQRIVDAHQNRGRPVRIRHRPQTADHFSQGS